MEAKERKELLIDLSLKGKELLTTVTFKCTLKTSPH